MKVIQVCDLSVCANQPFKTAVGKEGHVFCCEKGFTQSLKDFQKYLHFEGGNNFKATCSECKKEVTITYELYAELDKWEVFDQYLCPDCEFNELLK